MGEKQRYINDMVDAICSEIGQSKKDRIKAALEDHLKGWFFTYWHWDDLKQQACNNLDMDKFDDDVLTDKQCQEAEDFILSQHDACIGINWDSIDAALDEISSGI